MGFPLPTVGMRRLLTPGVLLFRSAPAPSSIPCQRARPGTSGALLFLPAPPKEVKDE